MYYLEIHKLIEPINNFFREWDGMVRELLEQRADVAIGDLTITYEREHVVDFTMPFVSYLFVFRFYCIFSKQLIMSTYVYINTYSKEIFTFIR